MGSIASGPNGQSGLKSDATAAVELDAATLSGDDPIQVLRARFARMEITIKLIDPSLKVRLGKPGGGSYINNASKTVTLDPIHLLMDPDFAQFVACHEGFHARILPTAQEIGLPRKLEETIYGQPGFGYLDNVIEDCAGNDFGGQTYPGVAPIMDRVYAKQFSEEGGVMSTPEVDEIASALGYYPKFSHFGTGVLRAWHKWRVQEDVGYERPFSDFAKEPDFGTALDPQIHADLQKCWEDIRDAIAAIPKSGAPDRGEVIEKRKERLRIVYEKIWPVVQKLVDEDLNLESMRQAIEDYEKKLEELRQKQAQQQQAQGNPQAQAQLQKEIDDLKKQLDPFSGLPDQVRKELEKAAESAIKEEARRFRESLEKGIEKINQNQKLQEQLKKDIEDLERRIESADPQQAKELEAEKAEKESTLQGLKEEEQKIRDEMEASIDKRLSGAKQAARELKEEINKQTGGQDQQQADQDAGGGTQDGAEQQQSAGEQGGAGAPGGGSPQGGGAQSHEGGGSKPQQPGDQASATGGTQSGAQPGETAKQGANHDDANAQGSGKPGEGSPDGGGAEQRQGSQSSSSKAGSSQGHAPGGHGGSGDGSLDTAGPSLEDVTRTSEPAASAPADKSSQGQQGASGEQGNQSAKSGSLESLKDGIEQALKEQHAKDGVVPLQMDQLSADALEALREMEAKMDPALREELREKAKQKLGELEDQMNEALKPELTDVKTLSHKEIEELKESLEPQEQEKRKRRVSGVTEEDIEAARNVPEILEKRRRGNLSDFERAAEDCADAETVIAERIEQLPKTKRPKHVRNQRHGVLDNRAVKHVPQDPRKIEKIYQKRTKMTMHDLAIGLIRDISGSMTGEKAQAVMRASVLATRVLQRAKSAQAIFDFADDVYRIMDWNDSLDDEDVQKAIASGLHTLGGTDDAAALRALYDEIKRRPEKLKFLFVFSDSDSSVIHELASVLELIKSEGEVVVIHFGVGNNTDDRNGVYPYSYGNLQIRDPNEPLDYDDENQAIYFDWQLAHVMVDVLGDPERYFKYEESTVVDDV